MRKLLAVILLCAASGLLWHLPAHEAGRRPDSIRSTASATHPAPVAQFESHITRIEPAAAPGRLDLRGQFRASRNYADFVHAVTAAAVAGDPAAQYLVAKALRYCNTFAHSRLFLTPAGALRSRTELEARIASFPASYQQDTIDAYERCDGFLQDPNGANVTATWETWLDTASAAGYPPAESLKADVGRETAMMATATREAQDGTIGDYIPPARGADRNLAVRAAVSGDPDSIAEMMNWVDASARPDGDAQELTQAWQLLACQRGNDDCGSDSRWLKSTCADDARCVEGETVTDYLQRMLGSSFDDVRKLAGEIAVAIDHQDQAALETYL